MRREVNPFGNDVLEANSGPQLLLRYLLQCPGKFNQSSITSLKYLPKVQGYELLPNSVTCFTLCSSHVSHRLLSANRTCKHCTDILGALVRLSFSSDLQISPAFAFFVCNMHQLVKCK